MLEQGFGEHASSLDRRMPFLKILRNVFEVRILGEGEGGCLLAPAGQAGEAVGGVAHDGQEVWDRLGLDAELGDDSALVADDFATPIKLDDASALDALGEVFVRRTDQDPADPLIQGGLRGGGG